MNTLKTKKKSFEFKNAVVQSVISMISTVIVLLTLFEMQAARNATYMPNVSVGKTEIAIAWDQNGTVYNIDEETKEVISKVKSEEAELNSIPKIKIYNIGVGTAENIALVWNHEKNMKNFVNAFQEYDDIEIDYKNGMVYTKTSTSEYGTGINIEQRIDFMLNSTQEYNTLILPIPYANLIKELFFRAVSVEEIPSLLLDVYYSDIQGKNYNKQIQFNTKILFYMQNPDGSGCCTYELEAIEEKQNMNTLSLSNISPDILMAVTSIFAVLVSIISMAFTVIFSILQIKHNKNSVRPISSIKINDYKDKISVKIHNDGTGPLVIKKLILKNDIRESSTLISMMPQIEQPWTTFTEIVDGWTIPVGGKIILLELNPESEEIKETIRRELSKITVSLDYMDIYKTEFHDSRKLDFFDRHYN